MFFWKTAKETVPERPIRISSVEWRDGQQSLLATRIRTQDMLPILPKMDEVGYECMEMWGGATFDVAIRYLGDDPWERVREFKKLCKKTPLRMLLRGQNLIGYKQYPDDVVEKFVELAAKAGIDKFLVFDGLNDVRNTETAIKAVLKNGKTAEANICYTISPVHTLEKYVQMAKDYAALGVKVIHVEDMAGMMNPKQVSDVIRAIRKEVGLPVHFHAHCIGGMADICYWEAIKAGACTVDCDVSALSLGPAHPPVESIVTCLKGTGFDPHLDMDLLAEINDYFMKLREKYKEFASKRTGVDISVLKHQIPGGMLSNLESQLKGMNAENRINEVFEEVHKVHKDFGYPPLANYTVNGMNFMLKGLLPAIIAGIGINSISIETMISYFTPAALVIIVLAVLGAYIGAIIFGHLFGLWGYEAGITAGLCCCNIGGSGDLAVLTAGDRMSLLAFSSISTRIGGALMVVWIGFLYPMLMLK